MIFSRSRRVATQFWGQTGSRKSWEFFEVKKVMKGHDVFFKVIKGHAKGVKVCDPIYSHRLLETLI